MLLIWSSLINLTCAYFLDWRLLWLALFPWDFYIFSLCFLAIHECGHAVAGRLVGCKLQQIAIGPLLLEATPAGIARSFRRGHMFTGFVKGEFAHERRQLWRNVVFTAGGPAADLLATIVLFGLANAGAPAPIQWQLWLLFAVSCFDLIWNLVRTPTEGPPPDGRGLLQLWRIRHEYDRLQICLALVEALNSSRRPREWEVSGIEILLSSADREFAWSDKGFGTEKGRLLNQLTATLAYYWAWDRGDIALVNALMTRGLALERPEQGTQQAYGLGEAAFCAAAFRGDASTARDLLSRARMAYATSEADERTESRDLLFLRAEAAIFVAEGESEQAKAKCQEWLTRFASTQQSLPILQQVEHEWVENTLQSLEIEPLAAHHDPSPVNAPVVRGVG